MGNSVPWRRALSVSLGTHRSGQVTRILIWVPLREDAGLTPPAVSFVNAPGSL